MNSQNKKNLDTEIDLLPFISVLAVCISFLLITAVWVHVGAFNLSQALGTESVSEDKDKQPSLWIHFDNDGDVSVAVKNTKLKDSRLMLSRVRGLNQNRANLKELTRIINKIKKNEPKLNMALLMPAAGSQYDDIIQVMDQLRKTEIKDIGIAPL